LTDILPPENGWLPTDFPEVTVVPVPYTTMTTMRADPYITITQEGSLYIEAGNTRIVLPRETDWDKLVSMVSRMFYAHHLALQETQEVADDSADAV